MKKRNSSIDTWKGIAIIAVIGIHACNGAFDYPFESANHWVGLSFRAIFNFAVALFFAISGYFSPDYAKLKKDGILLYYRKRLLPLWIPYILWTGLNMLIRDWSLLMSPFAVFKALLMGTGIGIGYFVIVLSSLTIIHPLLARFGRRIPLYIGAIISFISVSLLYWIRLEYSEHAIGRFPLTALPFTTWMVFFYLGFYIQSRKQSEQPRKARLLWLIVFGFSISLLESLIVSGYTGVHSVAASQVKFSTYFYSICICIYALYYGPGRIDGQRYLVWLGKHSYVLYLCHMLFLSRIGASIAPFFQNMQFVDIIVSTALTTLAATACIYTSEKLLPKPLPEYILGIKKS